MSEAWQNNQRTMFHNLEQYIIFHSMTIVVLFLYLYKYIYHILLWSFALILNYYRPISIRISSALVTFHSTYICLIPIWAILISTDSRLPGSGSLLTIIILPTFFKSGKRSSTSNQY